MELVILTLVAAGVTLLTASVVTAVVIVVEVLTHEGKND